MTAEDEVPTVPQRVLSEWNRTETTSESLFQFGSIRVTGHTAIYEDATLRETVRARTGVDRVWRFVFTTRLVIEPRSSVSAALRRLVTERARRGYRERLADRGFSDVREADSRTLRVGDVEAEAHRFEAHLELEDVVLSMNGWVAVWPHDGEFRIVGGAYPTSVLDAEKEGLADALRDVLDPNRFRESLFAVIRATE